MRIGILTLPLHINYGGILQAYALQTVLERMGHDVVVFDRPLLFKISKTRKLLSYTKRWLLSKSGKKIELDAEKEKNDRTITIRKYTQIFIEKHIHRYEYTDLNKIPEERFDAIVVGSDQIWRRLYLTACSTVENTFLAFARKWNIRKVAYAASFGLNKLEYTQDEIKKCRELIKLFDSVSTRENSGIDICKNDLQYDSAIQVLDPTMLLTRSDYEQLYTRTSKSEGNLLLYVLDENERKEKIISEVTEKTGLSPFKTNTQCEDNTIQASEKLSQPPVEKWLRGFHDAEFVVTDSFHACVFSILYNKPFLIISNPSRGIERFTSLLEFFGLENRIVSETADKKKLASVLSEQIDWEQVNSRLEGKRKESQDFLVRALSKQKA